MKMDINLDDVLRPGDIFIFLNPNEEEPPSDFKGGGKISNALPKKQTTVASVLIQNVQELIERETNSEIKDEAHSKVKGVTKLEEAENNSKPRAHVSKNPSPGPVLISTPESVTSDTLEPVQTTTPEPLQTTAPEFVPSIPETVANKNLETVSIISPEPIKVPSPEPFKASTPEPVRAASPDSMEVSTPELVKDATLEPIKVRTPEPKPLTPEPSITHEPLEVTTFDPVQTYPTELVTSSNLETHKIPFLEQTEGLTTIETVKSPTLNTL